MGVAAEAFEFGAFYGGAFEGGAEFFPVHFDYVGRCQSQDSFAGMEFFDVSGFDVNVVGAYVLANIAAEEGGSPSFVCMASSISPSQSPRCSIER